LIEFIDKAYNDKHSTVGEINCCMTFLNSLYDKRKQWIRRFIIEESSILKRFIGHVKTTQRVESLNRVIAEDTSPSNGLVKTFECTHERQKLRFLETRATLISEVMSTSSISASVVHPLFQDLISKTSKFITKKVMDEIAKSSLYVIETRPSYKCVGIFVVKHRERQEPSDIQKDTDDGITEYRRKFRYDCRHVSSKIEDSGLVSLACTCMLFATRGYPCRHMLFVYATECAISTIKDIYLPINSYLNSYWQISTVLSNFDIQLEVPLSDNTQRQAVNTMSIPGLANNIADNVKCLEYQELKVHEFKVHIIITS